VPGVSTAGCAAVKYLKEGYAAFEKVYPFLCTTSVKANSIKLYPSQVGSIARPFKLLLTPLILRSVPACFTSFATACLCVEWSKFCLLPPLFQSAGMRQLITVRGVVCLLTLTLPACLHTRMDFDCTLVTVSTVRGVVVPVNPAGLRICCTVHALAWSEVTRLLACLSGCAWSFAAVHAHMSA
jgi:hypothetical protein